MQSYNQHEVGEVLRQEITEIGGDVSFSEQQQAKLEKITFSDGKRAQVEYIKMPIRLFRNWRNLAMSLCEKKDKYILLWAFFRCFEYAAVESDGPLISPPETVPYAIAALFDDTIAKFKEYRDGMVAGWDGVDARREQEKARTKRERKNAQRRDKYKQRRQEKRVNESPSEFPTSWQDVSPKDVGRW